MRCSGPQMELLNKPNVASLLPYYSRQSLTLNPLIFISWLCGVFCETRKDQKMSQSLCNTNQVPVSVICLSLYLSGLVFAGYSPISIHGAEHTWSDKFLSATRACLKCLFSPFFFWACLNEPSQNKQLPFHEHAAAWDKVELDQTKK
ncbi:hypothetical protein FKM82_016856 [Ascaphus truei]